MLPRFRFAALMISIVLPGCTTTGGIDTTGGPPPDTSCTTSHCSVSVLYEQWPWHCIKNCKPIAPNRLSIFDSTRNWKQTISWELPANSNFRFAKSGIAFSADSGFKNCHPDGNSNGNSGDTVTKWTCTNNGKSNGDIGWKYTIMLESTFIGSDPLDPFVVNH